MPKIFATPRALIGQDGLDLGICDWLTIEQARIDAFADCTGDHQWIHVDSERAASGPFGATIAHGYLTLSLVNVFLPQLIDVRGFSAAVNVGADRLRFLSPVRVGSRIRGRGELISAEEIKPGAVQSIVRISVEIDAGNGGIVEKPACVVDTISRYFVEE